MIGLAHGTTTTPDQADQLHRACRYPQPDWAPGSAEPWITDLVASLLLASGQTAVLELGGYKGSTSRVLRQTLDLMGGGTLTVVEHDPTLTPHLRTLLPHDTILEQDALDAIRSLPDRSLGFVWIDDTHFPHHVNQEILALLPKMVDTGILTFHDVHGSYQLHHLVSYYGGAALDLPRVSTAGGLGILQVGPSTRTIEPAEVSEGRVGDDLVVKIFMSPPRFGAIP